MTTPLPPLPPEEEGVTFVVQTPPVTDPLLVAGGIQTRVTIAGDGLILSKVFIGEVARADQPFKALVLYQLSFGGRPDVTFPVLNYVLPPATPDRPLNGQLRASLFEGEGGTPPDAGTGTDYFPSAAGIPFAEITSDPLPQGLHGENGLLIAAHVLNDHLGARVFEPGWTSKYRAGDYASDLDKGPDENGDDAYTTAEQSVFGVIQIEQYNPLPPPEPPPPFIPIFPP